MLGLRMNDTPIMLIEKCVLFSLFAARVALGKDTASIVPAAPAAPQRPNYNNPSLSSDGAAIDANAHIAEDASLRPCKPSHINQGGPWWWARGGGLRRAGGGASRDVDGARLRRAGYIGRKGGVSRVGSRVPTGAASGGVGNLDPERLAVVAQNLARYRAGAGGGYNYDDDYYGGPGREDPYYEDGGGWGDEGGRRDRGSGGGGYDPYDDRKAPKRARGSGGGGFDLTGTITSGNKKYGVYALAGSVLLTMMGISLMFERNLIRLGNLGFVAGMALFIGPSNVIRYFTQASKLRGTIIFMVGFFFVFTGHPIVGLAVEVFGFLNLFGNMLPMLWAMASNMPFIKDIIDSGGNQRKKSGRGKQKRPSRQAPPRYDDDYGYDDDGWDNGGGGWGGYDDYERR